MKTLITVAMLLVLLIPAAFAQEVAKAQKPEPQQFDFDLRDRAELRLLISALRGQPIFDFDAPCKSPKMPPGSYAIGLTADGTVFCAPPLGVLTEVDFMKLCAAMGLEFEELVGGHRLYCRARRVEAKASGDSGKAGAK